MPHSKILVVTLQGQAEAVFVDLRSTGGRWELDLSASLALNGDENENGEEATETSAPAGRRRCACSSLSPDAELMTPYRETATICRFNPRGDLVYVGSSLGTLYVFDARTKLVSVSRSLRR